MFKGLTASISGAVGKDKQRSAELFSKHGGTYLAEMTKQCTHLFIVKKVSTPREVSNKEV